MCDTSNALQICRFILSTLYSEINCGRRLIGNVTNLMYTSRSLFSRLFLQICRFILSLYIVGQLVTLPRKICANILHYASAVITASVDKVWWVYIHKVNRITRCRDTTI